jgi:hypothetical protein
MPLVKLELVTFDPGTPGTPGRAETLTCQPLPPDPSPTNPPPTNPPPPEQERIYLYVPDNPNPAPGSTVIERRTPSFAPAPPGYVCSTGTWFDVVIGGITTPVRETRCYWQYP